MHTDDAQRLETLFYQWQNQTLSEAEQAELTDLLHQARQQKQLSRTMQKAWGEVNVTQRFSTVQKEAMLRKILDPPKKMPVALHRWVAAAVVLALLAGAAFWLLQPAPSKKTARQKELQTPVAADIAAPAFNKAILTLGDGRQILLDSAANGALLSDGGMKILKSRDGRLVYTGAPAESSYNTVTVPKGSQPVQIILADGSTVQVNVASSITYPTAFTGAIRKVTLRGEAYFTVTRRTAPQTPSTLQPFIVEASGMQVVVHGTRFNIQAYTDEAAMKTTLLEGAVSIEAGGQQQLLAPGEQALVQNGPSPAHAIQLVPHADVEEATAWLHGKFRFTRADVTAVMRQVARWYDVEVVYAARPNLRFGGQIDRSSTLRQMLTILEASGLHFSFTGNTVTVLP